jgi:hypothetical protein
VTWIHVPVVLGLWAKINQMNENFRTEKADAECPRDHNVDYSAAFTTFECALHLQYLSLSCKGNELALFRPKLNEFVCGKGKGMRHMKNKSTYCGMIFSI